MSLWRAAVAVLLITGAAAAQQPASPIIDRVEIRRSSVFDADEATFFLLRTVNALHVTTREYVIRRELLLGAGMPWDSARAAESARNLRRLGVFRSVTIDSVRTDSGLVARVETRDGWSTRPDFRFRSTGGELDYTLALIEDNLLGTASQASLVYHKNPDRTTTVLGFRQPRLIAGQVGLNARWDNRSDGERLAVLVNRPFFRLESRNAWGITGERRDERILRFDRGIPAPIDSVFRNYALLRVDGAHAFRAGTDGYLRGGVAVQLRRDNTVPGGPLTPQPGLRQSTAAVGGWLEWRNARFETVTGYNAQGRAEDVDLSDIIRIGGWLAPSSFGYVRSGVGPELSIQTGRRFPGGFARAAFDASGLYNAAGLDSGSVQLQGTVAVMPGPRHLLVLHGTAGAIQRPLAGSEFDLGLGAGPRGFRQHAFTGDRMLFTTAEYRYGLANDFLKVAEVGLAAFIDYGGAWYNGSERRTGWDAGVGLRLGTSRAPDLEANRLDLVYRSGNDREPAGWVFVVAKGFTFGSGLRGGQ
ncbi:MAG TPA: BamA/TamA family outer membrane protein [Gemmatimonadales bacterium]|nr:BamA/TamA family outer membrane protein [Gemmatimonadales bacterium]